MDLSGRNDTEWMDKAACKGSQDLFFSYFGESPSYKAIRESSAIKICQSCVVVEPCYDYAVTHNEYEIWGGTTELDRHRIQRRNIISNLNTQS